jgi:hypothetical protein
MFHSSSWSRSCGLTYLGDVEVLSCSTLDSLVRRICFSNGSSHEILPLRPPLTPRDGETPRPRQTSMDLTQIWSHPCQLSPMVDPNGLVYLTWKICNEKFSYHQKNKIICSVRVFNFVQSLTTVVHSKKHVCMTYSFGPCLFLIHQLSLASAWMISVGQSLLVSMSTHI